MIKIGNFDIEKQIMDVVKKEMQKRADVVGRLFCDVHNQHPRVIMKPDGKGFDAVCCCDSLKEKVKKFHHN